MERLKRRMTRAFVAASALLAVGLLIACQGPAGVAGSAGLKGDSGSPGTPGTPGTPGAPGISPLVTTEKASALILLNRRSLENTLGTGSEMIDLTGYFRGGEEPITYALVPTTGDDTVDAADAIFKVEPSSNTTGMFTVKAKAPRAPITADKYLVGEKVTFKATDADKIPAEAMVTLTIKPNQAPVASTDDSDAITSVLVTVGAQNAKDAGRDGLDAKGTALVTAAQPNPVCATFASCFVTIALPAHPADETPERIDATYTAKDLEGDSPAADAVDVIEDDDVKGMTFSVVEYDPDYVMASASGTKIAISGVKSTWVADMDPTDQNDEDPGHSPTMVRIIATDANDLMVERDISVRVDGPPTLSKTHLFESRYEVTVGTFAFVNFARFFADKETAFTAMTYTVASSNQGVVEIPANISINSLTDALTLTVHQGTATVTLTATDGRMQTVKASFTMVVRAAAPTQ